MAQTRQMERQMLMKGSSIVTAGEQPRRAMTNFVKSRRDSQEFG